VRNTLEKERAKNHKDFIKKQKTNGHSSKTLTLFVFLALFFRKIACRNVHNFVDRPFWGHCIEGNG